MKKVVNKITGLSIVLAMVFSLYVPMWVSAVDANNIEFNSAGGTFSMAAGGGTAVKTEDCSSSNGKLTLDQAGKYVGDNAPTKDNCKFLCWEDEKEEGRYYTADDLMQLDASAAGITLTAVWKQKVEVTVKHMFDGTELVTNTYDIYANDAGTYNITENDTPEVYRAILSEISDKYTIANYSTTGGGIADVTFNNADSLAQQQFTGNNNLTISVNHEEKKFTVTLHDNYAGGNNDSISVPYGDTTMIAAFQPLREGYKFVGWYWNAELLTIYDLSAPVISDLNLYAKWSKIYNIIDGNHGVELQKGMDLVVRADGEAANLQRLLIDGNVVDPSYYTITSGSTIATIKSEYLDTLQSGDHTLTFVYNDGAANVNFKTVAANDSSSATVKSSDSGTSSSSPKTGDSGIAIWAGLLLASVAGAAVSIGYLKKVK